MSASTPRSARRPTASGAEDDPLLRTFTYEVPDRLIGRIEPGHLVWVTFRGRRLQAVVLRLFDAAPDFKTREIISRLGAARTDTGPACAGRGSAKPTWPL